MTELLSQQRGPASRLQGTDTFKLLVTCTETDAGARGEAGSLRALGTPSISL